MKLYSNYTYITKNLINNIKFIFRQYCHLSINFVNNNINKLREKYIFIALLCDKVNNKELNQRWLERVKKRER